MLDHEPPAGAFKFPRTPIVAVDEPHPDRRERVENLKRMLERAFPERARFETATRATRGEIERVHDPDYVGWLESFCADGGGRIGDTTTGANEATFDAARYAAGTAVRAARDAVDGSDAIPYALCRPSGHHAQSDRADGFCFLNNVAVAAAAAVAGGVERVAIVDWDVHHCNGTQEIFEAREDVLVVSAHHDHGSWHPEYHPQEGTLDEVGTGDGEGYNVNVPLPPGTGDRGYERLFERIVEPVVREYDPELILVSAGQDAGAADPNGRNLVTRAGFRTLGHRIRRLAADVADDRLALVQEGGYQQSHLSFATLGVFEGVLGHTVDLERYGTDDPFDWLDEPTDLVNSWIDDAVEYHSDYWPLD
ncbi:arginase family protein [Halegenticoccus soli]|uniref:class II histone deacetylase n=1 Tax=Halegenticoccus soli TaxID=1985678 RepID=UPI000C6E227F